MAPITRPLKSRTGSADAAHFGIEFAVVDGEPARRTSAISRASRSAEVIDFGVCGLELGALQVALELVGRQARPA